MFSVAESFRLKLLSVNLIVNVVENEVVLKMFCEGNC